MSGTDDRTDASLLKAFAEGGDHAAFTILVERHGPMVHAVAKRMVSSHHDAQDVTQAVFLVLARDAGKLARKPSVAGWLHTVARRLALNARESRERRQHREQAAMSESTTITPDAVRSAGFRRELDAALASLPDHYRQPLVLFHLEGASLKETARRLELHPTTLRTRLLRAREQLRQTLTRRGVEVASVGSLAALVTAETKAAAFTPVLLQAVLDSALSGGGAASPAVLKLASKATGIKALTASSSLTGIALLMKSKASATSVVVLALAVLGTTVYVIQQGRRGADPPPRGSVLASKLSRAPSGTSRQDPLSEIAAVEEFEALVEAVLLIDDEDERLAAIRGRLGMDVTEEQYREAVTAYGYQVAPMTLFGHLFGAWLRDNPQAVVRWSGRFPEKLGSGILRKSFVAWWFRDEDAALAWAQQDHRESAFADIAQDLRKLAEEQGTADLPSLPASPAEASAMLRGMHTQLQDVSGTGAEARARRSLLVRQIAGLAQRWAQRDAKAAAEFVHSLHPSTRNLLAGTVSIDGFVERWAHADPDGALAWAKGVEHPQERIEALAAVLPSWQLKHPGRTLDEAVDLEGIPDARFNYLVQQLVSDWAVSDPAAAVDYAMQLRDEGLRKKMVTELAGSWARKDLVGAQEWARGLPDGELRDASLGQVGERVAKTDFAAAGELVREIGARGARDHAYHRIIMWGMRSHFTDALRLADDGMSELPFDDLRSWAHEVRPEDIPAFRAWLDKVRDDGRIQWHPRRQTKAVDPDKGYQFILGGLRPEQGETGP